MNAQTSRGLRIHRFGLGSAQAEVLPSVRGTMVAMTIRVGVSGAAGRMGSTVCRAVHDADGMELVAAVDPGAGGRNVADVGGPPVEIAIAEDVAACVDAGADVVVDFTVAAASRANLPVLAEAGVHAVVNHLGPEAVSPEVGEGFPVDGGRGAGSVDHGANDTHPGRNGRRR